MKQELNKHIAFYNIAEEFRNWQRQWDLFSKQKGLNKPPHLDEFMEILEQRYIVEFRP